MWRTITTLSVVAFSILSFSLSACDEHRHESYASDDQHEATTEHSLRTNHGDKWPMDDHTRSMFCAMAQKTAAPESDLKTLATSL